MGLQVERLHSYIAKFSCVIIIPALTPNRCRNFQLYWKCEPRNPEWETSVGDKCGRQVRDKRKLSPKNPEWETSVGNKSGRQVWETRVGDKCGRQV